MRNTSLPISLSITSGLVADYVQRKSGLDDLIQVAPDLPSIQEYASRRQLDPEVRKTLCQVLEEQYASVEMSPETRKNLDLLKREETVTVTTGHQICLLTGPFFSISKIASAIALARQVSSAVPVFWMATEDHDFEEINHVEIFGKRVSWDQPSGAPVGRMLTASIETFLSEVEELFGPGQLNPAWIEKWRSAYAHDHLANATRQLFNDLFGHLGLVILDADDARLKVHFSEIIAKELSGSFSEHAILATNRNLESMGYKAQVTPRDINLFMVLDGVRQRITRNRNGVATADESAKWTEQELMEWLQQHPGDFSPNVVLRPVYQECILPNVAYIGGPGEVAYWLQLKDVFQEAGINLPAIVLRDHFVPVSKAVSRKMESLGLEDSDIFKDPQEVIQHLLQDEHMDWREDEEAYAKWWEHVIARFIGLDPTLAKAAEAEKTKAENGFRRLQDKAARAVRSNHETTVNKVNAIHSSLFPEGAPIERVANLFQFAPEDPVELIDFMVETCAPTRHLIHVIRI